MSAVKITADVIRSQSNRKETATIGPICGASMLVPKGANLDMSTALTLHNRATSPVVIPDHGYGRLIALLSPVPLSLDGLRWVEAWMRIEHHTLNHLSQGQAKKEIKIALQCISEAGPDDSEDLAQSFGL